MKSKNICKFTSSAAESVLNVSRFVLESDPSVMQAGAYLKQNRLILVSKGQGVFELGADKLPFCAGSIVFGFAGEMFAAYPCEESRYMYIDFEGARAQELLHRFDITRNSRVYEGFDGLIPLWQDSLARAEENTTDLASESMLLYTFSRLPCREGQSFGITQKMLELSEQNFSDPSLCLAYVARELGYNSKYISHLFKQKIGVSYTDYLRTLRIKYAVSLFDHQIDSVKNVALLSGFSDPMYFSSVFKKELGLSPREYIKSIQKNRDINDR